MQMPWGKHKDENIEEIPSEYLWWIIEEAECVNKNLAEAVEAELEERE